jgi:hypothetical protein
LYKPGGTLFIFPNSTTSVVDKNMEARKTIIKRKMDPLAAALASEVDQLKAKKNQIVSLVDDYGNQFVPQYISESNNYLSLTTMY